MRNAREWSTELVKRDGAHAYTDMIRAPGDPERSPRRPKGDPLRDTLALWRRRLLKDSIADWAPRIFDHLADGQARTLNRIGVEMIDKTADNLLSTPFHEALWSLVEMGSVEHTMRAPILFRRRRIEGPMSSLVSPADDEPTPATKDERLPAPFLKWAGGKRQLLGELLKHIPAKFSVYVEPMIGGGAMFFELRRLGILDDAKRIVLADINEELVNTYRIVRDDVGSLQRTLARFENTEAFYKCMRAVNPSSIDPVRRAARFIYLNRCGFNGLYRVNQSGQFNVPFGKAKNPTICNVPVLDAASQALKGVEIMCAQFPVTCLTAQVCRKGGPAQVAVPGGVVYFDPPYWPVSKTSDFTAYDADGFGPDDHKAMRDLAVLMRAQGTHVVVSNADVEGVRELYRAEQFDLHRVEARRNINRDADKRGPVGELIMVAR
jgi:DNA adenine methylase